MNQVKEENYNVIRRSKPRIDGVEKVSGRALYAADLYMDALCGSVKKPIFQCEGDKDQYR